MHTIYKSNTARKGLLQLSLPEFPAQHHRPSLYQTTVDLLDSIALEEIALAHLLNAEAEKIQKFLGKISHCTPAEVLLDFNITVNETLETVIMKEWLLLRKLEKVIRFFNKHFSNCHHHSPCKPGPCTNSRSWCDPCTGKNDYKDNGYEDY